MFYTRDITYKSGKYDGSMKTHNNNIPNEWNLSIEETEFDFDFVKSIHLCRLVPL